MIYLAVQEKTIRAFSVARSSGGRAFETAFASRTYSHPFIRHGKVTNIDIFASATKEIFNTLPADTQVTLVLPSDSTSFFRVDIPSDVPQNDHQKFIKDKIKTLYKVRSETLITDVITLASDTGTVWLSYGIEPAVLESYTQPLALLDIHDVVCYPESLAYYTLFEKTTRQDKRENILFTHWDELQMHGYMFDTFGPLGDGERWELTNVDEKNAELALHQKSKEYEAVYGKLQRLIISGAQSETIRQDTFTKNVGVWTNPLKRIVPNFYQKYIEIINDPHFPYLTFDSVFGAFIFSQEHKDFKLAFDAKKKQRFTSSRAAIINTPMNVYTEEPIEQKTYIKEVLLFVGIFLLVFGIVWYLLQGRNNTAINIPFLQQPTQTPTPSPSPMPPTPTPTMAIVKEDIKILVQNGTGTPGQANGVKTLLETAGFTQVETKNADSYDYDVSEIYFADGKSYLEKTIRESIEDTITTPKIKSLQKDAETDADVVIIIGKDAK